jgi:hypothetical protein
MIRKKITAIISKTNNTEKSLTINISFYFFNEV